MWSHCGCLNPSDRYVVIGAQRDSLSWGYAKSAVGTTLLLELARVFTELKKGMLLSTCVQKQTVCVLFWHVLTPCPLNLRWFQAQKKHCVCQLDCRGFWERWSYWMAWGLCAPISSVLGCDNCMQFVLKRSYVFLTCCVFFVKQGYWSSLDRKAFTYISLDGVVTGKFNVCKW